MAGCLYIKKTLPFIRCLLATINRTITFNPWLQPMATVALPKRFVSNHKLLQRALSCCQCGILWFPFRCALKDSLQGVFCQAKFPKKSIKFPHFHLGIFPTFSGRPLGCLSCNILSH